MTTAKEVRLGLKSVLELGLTDTQVWPGLLGTVPHLPAVVIRRGPYKVNRYMGEEQPDPSFDLLCLQAMDVPERALDMDDLVRNVLGIIEDNSTIDGLVADIQVIGVGNEERIKAGGPNDQPMLGVGITINVII